LHLKTNEGQFAQKLFEIGYGGKVVSFEPLSSAYEKLIENSKGNKRWEVAERCALGDENGEIQINIAKNSQSSSILPMLQAHIDAAPHATYFDSETVKLMKLSDAAAQYMDGMAGILLKMDTQGYEEQVLKGADEIISKIKGIHLELSIVPLYEGQILFEEMLNQLKEMGFALYYQSPGFQDYRTGRLLQLNGTFFRE